jgi:thioredoxin 2
MSEEITHIVCPHCSGVNRVPVAKNAATGKCGRCHKPLFEGAPTAVGADSFPKHLQRNDIPMVVDFWAEWCGPCKAMAPIFAKVAKDLEPNVRFLKVDTEAEPALAARYNIRGIPTMMLFRNGSVVAQQVGAVSERAMKDWIRREVPDLS